MEFRIKHILIFLAVCSVANAETVNQEFEKYKTDEGINRWFYQNKANDSLYQTIQSYQKSVRLWKKHHTLSFLGYLPFESMVIGFGINFVNDPGSMSKQSNIFGALGILLYTHFYLVQYKNIKNMYQGNEIDRKILGGNEKPKKLWTLAIGSILKLSPILLKSFGYDDPYFLGYAAALIGSGVQASEVHAINTSNQHIVDKTQNAKISPAYKRSGVYPNLRINILSFNF